MGSITRQRDIIDRRALTERLSLVVGSVQAPALDRSAFVAPLKLALTEGRAEIRRRFEATGDGAATIREQCFLMDQLIRALFDLVTQVIYPLPNPTSGERLAIIPVGGYGRGELAPYSDIDLLFLLPYKRTPHTEQVVEYLLYLLWDLGLKIGQATRSVEECLRQAKADLTIRTGLLEARYLWGEQALFSELKRRFDSDIVRGPAAQFVDAKLAGRAARHRRVGHAQSFLWTVRCHLHYLAGRAEERLTFDLQAQIAREMGYADDAKSRGVERFMKDYFLVAKDVGDLTRIFCAILEADQKRKRRLSWVRWGAGRRALGGFVLDGEWLTIPAEDFFTKDPVVLLRLFHVAQEHGLDIHPRALRAASQSLRFVDRLRA